MPDPFSLTVSVLALAISAATAWLTLFRRGTVQMTQPTVIFFGFDTPHRPGESGSPKIFLRTLLFTTSKRGRIVENMYVTLCRGGTRQNFNVWVYGERAQLVRGSGVFVGETGVEANHHFLTPKDEEAFRFFAGNYRVEVFARLLGDRKHISLFSQALDLTPEIAAALQNTNSGVYFDWAPDSGRYLAHVDSRPSGSDIVSRLARSL